MRWRNRLKCDGEIGCFYSSANSPLSAEVEALQSIKGCGFALAAAFASEVGDFSRFRSGRQVTAYFGLAPKQRSSADSERLLRRREEMLERGMPQAKANAATAAELVRWLWALGTMCREAGE